MLSVSLQVSPRVEPGVAKGAGSLPPAPESPLCDGWENTYKSLLPVVSNVPTVTVNLSDEDYQQVRGKNRSKSVREALTFKRTHKCPSPKFPNDHKCPEPKVRTVTRTERVKVFLREGGEGHKGFDIWDGKAWVPAKKSDLS